MQTKRYLGVVEHGCVSANAQVLCLGQSDSTLIIPRKGAGAEAQVLREARLHFCGCE